MQADEMSSQVLFALSNIAKAFGKKCQLFQIQIPCQVMSWIGHKLHHQLCSFQLQGPSGERPSTILADPKSQNLIRNQPGIVFTNRHRIETGSWGTTSPPRQLLGNRHGTQNTNLPHTERHHWSRSVTLSSRLGCPHSRSPSLLRISSTSLTSKSPLSTNKPPSAFSPVSLSPAVACPVEEGVLSSQPPHLFIFQDLKEDGSREGPIVASRPLVLSS
jgi:hypothetical protein